MKSFILVAGVDYEFGARPFRQNCENRMEFLIQRNKEFKEDMVFKIFDFRTGQVSTTEVSFKNEKMTRKVSILSPSPFDPISRRKNYKVKKRFNTSSGLEMSILDIYNAVQEIGADAPNTLSELSFFSHAWMGGPILVNSFEDQAFKNTPIRDPDDRDPRVHKDFEDPNMDSSTDLPNFKDAFAPDGIIWIWGCAIPAIAKKVLQSIFKNPTYRKGKIEDDTLITIIFHKDDYQEFRSFIIDELSSIPSFLSRPTLNRKFEKINVEFKFVKLFLCVLSISSYSHKIAETVGVSTFGGVMGTSAHQDQTGKRNRRLMRIDPKFKKHITFYEDHLGFSFDKEHRGYGEYKPGFSCVIPGP